jgi:alkanesulfonate monooxygenase SsuD/methylene tetrahydromethanopterin reductase-like flavin-dependent oxidoreductase (luciferase family)
MPSLGFIIPQRGSLFGLGKVGDLLRLAVTAEDSGLFETVWVGDSLTSKARPEAVACLGTLAGMTRDLRLGVGCLGSFAIRDPALFALQWATLDQISEGRMLLAVCNGLQKREGASEREGANFGGVRDRERPGLVEEYLGVCRRLWAGETVDYRGSHVSYEQLQLGIVPRSQPAVWLSANPPLGGLGQRVLRRAVTFTDGLLTTQFGPNYLTGLGEQLHEELEKARRDAASFQLAVYHGIIVGPDRNVCLAEARRFYDEYYGAGMFDESAAEALTAAGPPERCISDLQDLIDQGATHIALRLPSWDQRGQFDMVLEQVLEPMCKQGIFEVTVGR